MGSVLALALKQKVHAEKTGLKLAQGRKSAELEEIERRLKASVDKRTEYLKEKKRLDDEIRKLKDT